MIISGWDGFLFCRVFFLGHSFQSLGQRGVLIQTPCPSHELLVGGLLGEGAWPQQFYHVLPLQHFSLQQSLGNLTGVCSNCISTRIGPQL